MPVPAAAPDQTPRNPTCELAASPCAHPRLSFLARTRRFILRIGDYCRVLGFWRGLRWFLMKALSRAPVPGTRGSVVSMQPPALAFPVRIRMFPGSDDFVFDEILIEGEHAPLRDMVPPRFIIDLGANAGYASALFASMYPDARILAVEPDPGNYRMCVENLRPYGTRVRPLLGAVWARPSRLALSRDQFGDGRDWAVQVREPIASAAQNDRSLVDAWDVWSLLELAGEEVADLIKIDIEGSEAAIFASNTGWLARVRNICIELHGEHCAEVFFQALRGYEYQKIEHGEKVFCLNLRSIT